MSRIEVFHVFRQRENAGHCRRRNFGQRKSSFTICVDY
jgi:hypothetical protein